MLSVIVFLLWIRPVILKEGSFWQVTDFHYDKTYLKPTDPNKICNSQTPNTVKPSRAGRWGNYLCDSPWRLINSTVFAMRDIEPNPDFIIWTGDDMPHVANSELSTEEVIETVQNLTDLLFTVFPKTKVYPALGNHDYHPKHLMPPTPNDIYTAVGKLWSRWLPLDAVNTFERGGYYTVLIKFGLRLVSLNTVYYYTNNRLTQNLEDPAGQFVWLDAVLTNASVAKEKVFIIGHVPPGVFERAPGKKWFYPQFNKKYIDVILKHADVITGHFLAHQHCDSFKVFYEKGYLLCWRRMMEPAAIYTFNAWLYGSFIISYVVIVVCYWKVFRAVEEHNAAVAPNLNQGNRNSQEGSRTEEVSVARAVATIVLSFTLCWIPAEVMDTMDKINPLLLPRQVFLVATCLWYMSSAINPIIYGVMNSTFRAEYKKVFSIITNSSSVRVSPPNSALGPNGQEMNNYENTT